MERVWEEVVLGECKGRTTSITLACIQSDTYIATHRTFPNLFNHTKSKENDYFSCDIATQKSVPSL